MLGLAGDVKADVKAWGADLCVRPPQVQRGRYQTRVAPAYGKPLMLATFTTSPVCGACTIRPLPR